MKKLNAIVDHCNNYFLFDFMSEDIEEKILDYLSDNNLDDSISIDSDKDMICSLIIEEKLEKDKSDMTVSEYIKNLKRRDIEEKEEEMKERKKVDYGNLPIDIYLKIALKADWETIKNMMNPNNKNKFDEQFFRNLLLERYPLLFKFKFPNVTYRNYYLQCVNAIAKLSEDFNFPYIPNKNFDVVKFYKNIKNLDMKGISKFGNYLLKEGLVYSAEAGNINLMEYFLERGSKKIEKALEIALEKALYEEQLEVILFLLKEKLISPAQIESLLNTELKNKISKEFYDTMEKIIESYNNQ